LMKKYLSRLALEFHIIKPSFVVCVKTANKNKIIKGG
jgi:hypothetical protein